MEVFEHLPGRRSVRDMLKVRHPYQNLKRFKFQLLQVHSDPIFTDEAVQMLMTLLIVFDSNSEEKAVRKVHGMALEMLNKHLRNEWGVDVSYSKVKRVVECVTDLPKILTAFAAIF